MRAPWHGADHRRRRHPGAASGCPARHGGFESSAVRGVRLASGSRDDPAGALAPLSVSATVRVEGWRGMLQRIRAAIDAEVAPMVGFVLLRHAL
jgi:hypothetical protein